MLLGVGAVAELVDEDAKQRRLRLAEFADDAERRGRGLGQQVDRGLDEEVAVVVLARRRLLDEADKFVGRRGGERRDERGDIVGAAGCGRRTARLFDQRGDQLVLEVGAQRVEPLHGARVVVASQAVENGALMRRAGQQYVAALVAPEQRLVLDIGEQRRIVRRGQGCVVDADVVDRRRIGAGPDREVLSEVDQGVARGHGAPGAGS